MDETHAEPLGYLAETQSLDSIVHLLSSGVHCRFNLEWIREPMPGASGKVMPFFMSGEDHDRNGFENQPGILGAEFIYDQVPFPQCCSWSIVETRDGLVAAWFGGTREGNPDVGIWTSRLTSGGWSDPVEGAAPAPRTLFWHMGQKKCGAPGTVETRRPGRKWSDVVQSGQRPGRDEEPRRSGDRDGPADAGGACPMGKGCDPQDQEAVEA